MKCSIVIGLLVSMCFVVNAQPVPFVTSGVVTDEFGKPLAGATVDLVRSKFAPLTKRLIRIEVLGSTKSSNIGEYTLKGELPKEEPYACIRAAAAGRTTSGIHIRDLTDGKYEFFDFRRQQPTSKAWLILLPAKTIRGIVVDEQDQPIAGCKVRTDDLRDAMTTGPDGKFEDNLAMERVENGLRASTAYAFEHLDYVHRSRVDEAWLPEGVQQPDGSLKIVLQSGVQLNGSVSIEGLNRPLSFATITASSPSDDDRQSFSHTVWADENGKFSVRVPPDRSIRFSVGGMEEAEGKKRYFKLLQEGQETFAAGQEPTHLNFIAVAMQSVRGVVKCPPGVDAKRLQVRAVGPDGTRNVGYARCKSDGSFEMVSMPSGNYTLNVTTARNQTALGSTSIEIAEGKDEEGVELLVTDAMTETQPFRGKVLNGDGTAAVVASVWMMPANDDGNHYYRPVYTELDGSFEFLDNPGDVPGTLWISSSSRDAGAALILESGHDLTTPIEIKLQPTASISGKVLDSEDKPISGASVWLRDVVMSGPGTYHRSVLQTRTDEEGKYVLKGFIVPDGVSNVQVEAMPKRTGSHQSMQSEGYKLTELKSGEAISGLNFRVSQSGLGMQILPELEQP